MADSLAALRRRLGQGGPARSGIARRLTRTFTLIAGALILLVGLALSWTSYRAILEQVEQRQQNMAREAALVSSTYLARARDTLDSFARLSSVRGLLLSDAPTQRQELINLMLGHSGLFQSVTLVDASGAQLAQVVVVGQDANAQPVYAAVDNQSLGSVAGVMAFQRAIAGEMYLSERLVDGQPGQAQVINVAVPMFGADRDGVVMANLGVDGLWKSVDVVDVGREGYTYVVDRTTGELVTTQALAAGDGGLTEPGYTAHLGLVERIVAAEPAATGGPGRAGTYNATQYRGLTGKSVIGAAHAIEGTRWALVAEVPANVALSSAHRVLYLFGLSVVLGAVVAGALGALIPRRLVRPILALQVGAKEIAQGNLEHTLEIDTGDELQDLADSFNQMAESLQSSYQELEQRGRDLEDRVTERTVELEAVTDQARKRADQLQISAEVAHVIASMRDLNALLPQVTRLLSERFGWYHVGIFLLDEATRPEAHSAGGAPQESSQPSRVVRKSEYAILRAANSQGGQRLLEADYKLQVSRVSVVGSVASTGQPRIALDAGSDAVFLYNAELPETRSEMALPLKVGERVIGVLDVQSTSPGAYHDEDVSVLSSLADQIAVAIENALLFEQTQEALREVRQLHRRYVEQEWVRSTAAQGELAYEYRRGAGTPVVVDEWPPELRLALAEERVVIQHPTPTSPSPDAARAGTEGAPDNGDAQLAALAVPIKLRDQVIGVVDLQEADEPRLWTDDEVALVQEIADQVALALENARLFADTQHRAEQLATLHRVGLDVTAALDLDGVLDALYQQINRIMDAESFYVALYDTDTGVIEFPLMIGDEGRVSVPSRHIDKEPGITGEVLVSGVPLYVPDLLYRESTTITARPFGAILIGERRTRSYMGVPLFFRERVFGVLSVQSYLPNAYKQEDLELLSTIATQASIAIQNARAYQQLVETAEQLREIDRLKTQFLANMSHELRTPLNSIIGFSRVMLKGIDGPLTDLQEADLNSIYGSGQHLLGLINSILDMSKIEAGKMDLAFEKVSLYDVFNTALSSARALIKDQPLELRSDIPEDLPPVLADAQRVRQVLLNLMSNATKFTEQGTITLKAALGTGTESKFVVISVSDTGIGMDEEAQTRLFIPFQQVDSSTTRRAGGTGLGLAISRSFVEMHGGRIWVESTPGVGSTFSFTLPIYEVAPAPEEQAADLPPEPVSQATGLPDTAVEQATGLPDTAVSQATGLPDTAVSQATGLPDTAVSQVSGLPPEPVAQASGLPDTAVAQAAGLPPEPVSQAAGLPPEPVAQASGLPDTAVEQAADLPPEPAEQASGLPAEPVSQASGLPAEPVPPMPDQILVQPGPGSLGSEPLAAEPQPPAAEPPDRRVVLVVDDDRGVVTLLKRYLESEGYQVVGAVESPQAVNMARELAPSLAAITLDIVMPRMDGWQVLRALKGDPVTRDVPVILCSIVDGLEHGLKLGADLWLRKPVTRDEVLNAVRKVGSATPSRPAGQAPGTHDNDTSHPASTHDEQGDRRAK